METPGLSGPIQGPPSQITLVVCTPGSSPLPGMELASATVTGGCGWTLLMLIFLGTHLGLFPGKQVHLKSPLGRDTK